MALSLSSVLLWLDQLSWSSLLIVAIILGLAPFPMQPESHLVEKVRMLFQGTLVRPIDIFDLLMHATPIVIIFIKLIRSFDQPPT